MNDSSAFDVKGSAFSLIGGSIDDVTHVGYGMLTGTV